MRKNVWKVAEFFLLKINEIFVIVLKFSRSVDRVDDRVAVGKWSDFHAAVDAAREHPAELVDLNLRDALAHVLEEAAVLVFAGVEEERRAHGGCEGPNLWEGK